jgi:F-type H+-transporting ATPase subunit delta
MNTESVAYVYALALSQADGADLKKIEEEMAIVAKVFQDDDVKKYFESPRVSSALKKEQLKKTFDGKISDLALNFLFLLVDKRRDHQILEIYAALTEIGDKQFNRVRPKISVSRNYPEGEVTKIVDMVKDLITTRRSSFGLKEDNAKLEFIPEIQVKPELVGGIYLRVGDYMWDSSVSRYLKDWKHNVLSGAIENENIISVD